ncbi:uncharacterized protein LOC104900380 [Beta vulgaris subsp. vulgaris]|uniref:uncharacterized protein LOC104900380 n=1 Tax=Beta vulgaris subsp. vulgaris TaxID=3555 RepID=UPI00053FAD2C|nr:uncharacterized protein LOC104900380 [Beta vulgaris subsp. vulgaris]
MTYHLRTVDGHLCATFQEAALKLGLLEEDDSIIECMEEASGVEMPSALRRLFTTILIFCKPSNPLALWHQFYSSLSEDFARKFSHEKAKIALLTIKAVEQLLEDMGKTLEDFDLHGLKGSESDEIRRTKDIVDALDAPIPEEYKEARVHLNCKQQEAFNSIMEHIRRGEAATFFVDGPGGTGKTYLYQALYAEVRLMNKIVLPVATSGIAAANIVTGRTAHSRFKIPLDHTVSKACNVSKQSGLAALIKETSLIIWDESSMARKENIESLDLLLRDLCDPNVSFGGKVVVFGGDFRQVLPVVPQKTQNEAVEASLVSSALWSTFTRFSLTENMRAREDQAFSEFLLDLGNGSLQTAEVASIRIPPQIVLPFDANPNCVDELVKSVFPEISVGPFPDNFFTDRAVLTPMNEDVDGVNNDLIAKFPGESVVYKSFDMILDDACNMYPTEFLNTLCPGGMSPHELVLKENSPVILLRNLAPAAGLCNGTRLICKRFLPNIIECVIITGHHKGEYVFLPRINLRPSISANYPFQFQRKQFPIKLSFAMTINKSQGQTLDQVGLYLHRPCFSHGQLYVGLSRARKSSKVKVLSSLSPQVQATTVKNVVSFKVLEKAGII